MSITLLERYNLAFEGVSDTKIIYEKYVVGYIDLLGVHELLKNDDGEALNKLNHLYNRLLRYTNQHDDFFKLNDVKVKIFSDNIIIASKIDEDINESAKKVITLLKIFQNEALFQFGWLLRGGVFMGDLYIDDVFTIGNGLISAYYIESSIANYPRVVIDKALIENIDMNEFIMPYGLEVIYQDFDNEYFINFLSLFNRDSIFRECTRLKQAFITLTIDEQNIKNKQKYNWLISYTSRILEWVDQNLKIKKKQCPTQHINLLE